MTEPEPDLHQPAGPSGGTATEARLPLDFWLKLVDRLINDHFRGVLEEHGLTRREWEMMRMLSTGPATRVELSEALAPFLGRTASVSSTEQLHELTEAGWVERQQDAYRLTRRGREAFERLDAVVERSAASITAGTSAEDRDVLLRVLRRMAHNLGWPTG